MSNKKRPYSNYEVRPGVVKNKIVYVKKEYKDEQFDNSPHVCKQFGCGKTLSNIESLYSEYCFKHQQQINQNKQL